MLALMGQTPSPLAGEGRGEGECWYSGTVIHLLNYQVSKIQ